jgi:multicomponent Na+:H+ antiporter subunit G
VTILEWVSAGLMGVAAVFFLAGTVGILRFPDTHSRLHALTKADNLGLGILVAGLILQAESAGIALKLLLAWILALIASAAASYLIATTVAGADQPRVAAESDPDA